MRLDKYLADMTTNSRSQIKKLIANKEVTINGEIIKKADHQVKENDVVKINDEQINYIEFEYYILNKPAGYLSASEDKYDKTIMELIKTKRKDLVPVGRLDKDSEGLILLTNDGQLNHQLLSPNNHVLKKYYVKLDKELPINAKELLENPMDLGDFITKPAIFEKINNYEAYLTISEGKFHQVKRMFAKIGCEVIYLQRISFKNLTLDNLQVGQYRQLTQAELDKLKES